MSPVGALLRGMRLPKNKTSTRWLDPWARPPVVFAWLKTARLSAASNADPGGAIGLCGSDRLPIANGGTVGPASPPLIAMGTSPSSTKPRRAAIDTKSGASIPVWDLNTSPNEGMDGEILFAVVIIATA